MVRMICFTCRPERMIFTPSPVSWWLGPPTVGTILNLMASVQETLDAKAKAAMMPEISVEIAEETANVVTRDVADRR